MTREPGSPLRVTIGIDEKTPKTFAKAKSCLKTESMTGKSYRYSYAQTMIYCNEERRKPFVTELATLLDTLFANKDKETFPHDKKVILYKWICNEYSESYFRKMKDLLKSRQH